jgi:hypothetical protein
VAGTIADEEGALEDNDEVHGCTNADTLRVLVGLKVLHNTTNGELEPDLGGPQNSLGVRLRLVVAAASGGGLVGGKRAVLRHTEASITVSRAWISSILGRQRG